MGLYQKLRGAAVRQRRPGQVADFGSASAIRLRHDPRADRLLRTPLLFETLEPRVLLSGDPITLTAQNALLAGLQSFESWTASNLTQTAQIAQQLPVVSTSVGDLVDLPGEIQTHIIQPAQAYFASTTSPTI